MDDRGFSLVETMVSTAIVLILALAGFQSAIAAGHCTAVVRRTLTAVSLAAETVAMERAAIDPPAPDRRDVVVGGCVYDITIRRRDTQDRHLRSLTVAVGWSNGRSRRVHEIRTFVWRPS